MLRATIALLALTVSAQAESEITFSCNGTATSQLHPGGPKRVTTSLIVDRDSHSVVFDGARAGFSPGISPQDAVLRFERFWMLDRDGHLTDGKGKGPLRGGSINRVGGAATISQVEVTSEDDPNFRDTAATQYELICKPVKPLF
jgi:hypothetical protein